MIAHRLSLAAVVVFAALITGCGFHLREEARLPASMQRVAVQGADLPNPLGRDLRKALARLGAQVVEGSAEPTAVLRIGRNAIRTDVLSVGGNARANEYTIRYQVEFDVVDPAGALLLPLQTLELSRIFTFDSSQALGIAAEQDLLTDELQREMVQAILRKLDLVGRSATP